MGEAAESLGRRPLPSMCNRDYLIVSAFILAAIPNQLGRTNRDATWSPDDKRIVFVSDRE